MISVIVPVYNAQDYIEKCLDSVINQIYKDIEIIVIDDGSTDNSLDLCKKYQLVDNRILVYSQKNQGPVAARKKGLELSKGEYVTFIDADDYIEPDMYSRLLKEINNSDYDFIHTGYFQGASNQIIGTFKKTLAFSTLEERDNFICDYVLNNASTECIAPSMWSKIYKINFIKECLNHIPDHLFFGEDLLLLCICILECNSAKCLNEAYYHYVNNENSITHDTSVEKIGQIIELHSAMKSTLMNYDVEVKLYNYIDMYIKWIVASYIMRMTKFTVNRYRLLNIDECIGKRVIIYGAGQVGQDIYSQISKYSSIKIIDWVDKNQDIKFEYAKVNRPETVYQKEFDYIVIAIKDHRISSLIADELESSGVNREKIIGGKIGIWT